MWIVLPEKDLKMENRARHIAENYKRCLGPNKMNLCTVQRFFIDLNYADDLRETLKTMRYKDYLREIRRKH